MATLPDMSLAPVITHTTISDTNYNVYQGGSVTIGVEIRHSGVFGPQKRIDLGFPLVMSLYDPQGNQRIVDASMSHYDVGRYYYIHHTQYNDPTGLWTARFTASLNAQSGPMCRLDNVGVFLLHESTFDTFDVFIMYDNTGNTWYVYVSYSGELFFSQTAPTFVGRVPKIVNKGGANALVLPDYITPSTHYYLTISPQGEAIMHSTTPIGILYPITTVTTVMNVVGVPAKLYGNSILELLIELIPFIPTSGVSQ